MGVIVIFYSTSHFRYTDQSPAPDPDTGGSIVLGLASSVWSVLTLGYGSSSDTGDTPATLADDSLQLLLLLTNHCTDTSAFRNPFREALFSFANASEKSVDTSAQFRLEYPPLYTTSPAPSTPRRPRCCSTCCS